MTTVHFYLNTVEKGGGTKFYEESWEEKVKDVASVKGRLAVFRQDQWLHEGAPVLKGLKYTVRNELLYKCIENDEISKELA